MVRKEASGVEEDPSEEEPMWEGELDKSMVLVKTQKPVPTLMTQKTALVQGFTLLPLATWLDIWLEIPQSGCNSTADVQVAITDGYSPAPSSYWLVGH